MGANGKIKQYNQVAGAVVDARTEEAIRQLAIAEDRPLAYVVRKLIEESPRIVQALNGNGKKRGPKPVKKA
jgi:hypothetical protein